MAEGATGGQQIALLEKGNSDRTAQHADVMNEIINAINKLYAMTVTPQGAGKFIWSDANGILDISGGAGGGVTVTTGDTSGGVDVSTLSGVTTITFDQDLFIISDAGDGECYVDLNTEECP